MELSAVLAFVKTHKYAVEASVSVEARPQAAVVGIAVTDDFEIVFDTIDTTRKAVNLRANPNAAFVIGGVLPGDERTVQYEGVADFPAGPELRRLQAIYFAAFPDGPSRLSWPGITYVRVRPLWIRYSDFAADPPLVVQFDFDRIT